MFFVDEEEILVIPLMAILLQQFKFLQLIFQRYLLYFLCNFYSQPEALFDHLAGILVTEVILSTMKLVFDKLID